jgi:uncharacterized protein (AIM24 family)
MPSSFLPDEQRKHHEKTGISADDITFDLIGSQSQYIELTLEPGDIAVADAGHMLFKDRDIRMETVTDSGSNSLGNSSLFSGVLKKSRPLVSGQSHYVTVFSNRGPAPAQIAFAPLRGGPVLPLKLDDYGNKIVCQRDCFLAVGLGVTLSVASNRPVLKALFGKDGHIMLLLEGDGWMFLHGAGNLIEKRLEVNEELHVEVGCFAACTNSIHYELMPSSSTRSALYNGESVYTMRLRGPGRVWMQSSPASRLIARLNDLNVPKDMPMGTYSGRPKSLGDIFAEDL